MAAGSFTCLLLLFMLFLLSNSCCSCPGPPLPCNGIEIRHPFSTNVDDPDCGGYISVECENHTNLYMQLPDVRYAIRNISYDDHTLFLRDEPYNLPPGSSEEDYLYNFTKPINVTHHALHLNFLEDTNLSSCKEHDHCLCDFLSTGTCVPCANYDIFYSNASESSRQGFAPICEAHEEKEFFEWKLSFSEYGELFLLYAGFSHGLTLRPDCFDKYATRGICKSEDRGKNNTVAIAAGITAASSFLLICAALLLYTRQRIPHKGSFVFRSKPNNMQRIEAFLEENGYVSPTRYKYSYLKRMTKSFHEKLGHGGFGTVFRGTLPDGRLAAVKMLNNAKGNGEEFINEVASIGRTSHVNVVRLLGFCIEGRKRALVYEFMSNGSLDKYICSEEQRMSIGWKRLHDIAVGIARGLEYLHRGCNTRIVHFDIKPHNILLDDEFCPKISDFGLAKLCSRKDSIISMMDARGTVGYIAPEVFCRNFGSVSTKSDVYSYGMMVLEMTGATKNPNAGDDNSSEAYFPYWVFKQLEQDGDLQSSETSEIAKRLILVGLWCIQTIPANRPSIRRVIEMLEGKTDDIEHPLKSSYLSPPLLPVLSSSS